MITKFKDKINMDHPVFLEIFEKLPQGAPGDDESSQKAFSLLNKLSDKPEILDVGCGTGRHTILLSRLSQGRITSEIEVYRNYKDYFEYMFYILQKKEELYIRSICGIRRKIE